MILLTVIFCCLSYLLSSIPFGLILCKVFLKIDIRSVGSGNIGTTNVFRQNKTLGIATFLLDASKTILMPIIMQLLEFNKIAINITLLSSVIGHIYSFFLKYQGGKGFASSLISLSIINPALFITCLISWTVMMIIFRIVGLASIISLLTTSVFSISMYFYHNIKIYDLIYTFIITGLVIFKHKKNIFEMIKKFELKSIKNLLN